MADKNRPLSPHLQVYRPQISSVMSIFHRITGFILTIGTLALAYWLVSAAAGPEAYATAQGFFGSWFGYLILFGWTACLFYHLSNGIRHLFWDAGYGFDLATVNRSGWTVVGSTVVLTLLAWIVGLSVGG